MQYVKKDTRKRASMSAMCAQCHRVVKLSTRPLTVKTIAWQAVATIAVMLYQCERVVHRSVNSLEAAS
eukprot:scaffold73946_cov33-Prasinocladus_malaysianus.AAC.1